MPHRDTANSRSHGNEVSMTRRQLLQILLNCAAKSRNQESVIFLLANGANINTPGRHENLTALQAAISHRGGGSAAVKVVTPEFIKFLLKNGAVSYPAPGDYGSELYLAAEAGASEAAKLFLDLGANMNSPGGKYGTPLHAAGAGVVLGCDSYADVGELLIERGAHVDPKDPLRPDLPTPLVLAARAGNLKLVNLLLEKGADFKNDVLLGAAKCRDVEKGGLIIQLVLEHGANANWSSREYGSVLYHAVKPKGLSLVQLLLKHGANVNWFSKRHGSVLHSAALSVELDVFQLC
jgi:ankyrin repeat protein